MEKPSRLILALVVLASIAVYLYFQFLIGSIVPLPCGIHDALQAWTSGINTYLHNHSWAANTLQILYSLFGDLSVLTLYFFMIFTRSIRPILPMFIFMVLRQLLQALVSLPLPTGLIWEYPGFPSLFSNYELDTDFYFSAFVGINLLTTLYLMKYRIRWLTILGFGIVIFEAFADIVLRSHYTTDIYTSIMTAIFSFLVAEKLSTWIDHRFQKHGSYRIWLILIALAQVALYFICQHFIGKKPVPVCTITDVILNLFLPVTHFFSSHPMAANAQLIAMNGILDILTLFIIFVTLWKKDIRPMLILIIFFTLRQSLQLLVKLPLPAEMIWHYPGFPSLLQSYTVSSDLYFSGHTGVGLLAFYEIYYFRKRWLTVLGFIFFLYEVFSILATQGHYTMDIFTAIMTVTCFTDFSFKIAPYINRFLAKASRFLIRW
ncbi:MAG: hypothetical protein K1X28_03560 [Parachlamydiales bacterium]|nr:hypothetical protein [Parachlamydiales bacterium]